MRHIPQKEDRIARLQSVLLAGIDQVQPTVTMKDDVKAGSRQTGR